MGALRHYRHRTLEERLEVHSRVAELRNSGLPIKEIALALGISRREVSYWLRVERPSRTVYNPDLTPRPELAYLVGAYLGDGRTAGKQDKKVRFKVADLCFAESLNGLVASILKAHVKPVKADGGFYDICYDSAKLYDFLQSDLASQIPLMESYPAMFLRGFFDAEGYVTQTLWHESRTMTAIRVGAANTNLEYLGHVRRLLAALGIASGLRRTNKAGQPMEIRGRSYFRKHDVFHVEIMNLGSVKAFCELVGFSIPQKENKLKDLLAIMSTLDESDRYEWFTGRYEKVGRKWVHRSPP
jgi:intein-encoded DNA endonuclease-like protein